MPAGPSGVASYATTTDPAASAHVAAPAGAAGRGLAAGRRLSAGRRAAASEPTGSARARWVVSTAQPWIVGVEVELTAADRREPEEAGEETPHPLTVHPGPELR